jgi:hypothetical protein
VVSSIIYITVKAVIKADDERQAKERIDALRECIEGSCKVLPFVGHVSLIEQER